MNKFKKGNKVRISSNLVEHKNDVVEDMLQYAGMTATVTSIGYTGVFLDVDGGHWKWESPLLTKLKKDSPKPIEVTTTVKIFGREVTEAEANEIHKELSDLKLNKYADMY